MIRFKHGPVCLLALWSLVLASAAHADSMQHSSVSIPTDQKSLSGSISMVTDVFLPEGKGPFPVVLFSHGRADNAAARGNLKAPLPEAVAAFFVAHGFAVVAPVRPGYGATGGPDVEMSNGRIFNGTCSGFASFEGPAAAAAHNMRLALDWTRRQPFAEKQRILLVGQSVGGMTTIVLAAQNPPGVVGAINFSGGSGGNPEQRPGASCGVDAMTSLYRAAGRTIRVPSLWLYAENDQFWGPEVPKQWYAAFASGKTRSSFVDAPALQGFGGHALMARAPQLWHQPVERFLQQLGFR